MGGCNFSGFADQGAGECAKLPSLVPKEHSVYWGESALLPAPCDLPRPPFFQQDLKPCFYSSGVPLRRVHISHEDMTRERPEFMFFREGAL